MIKRIERAAGALLIVAGVIILIGVGLSIAKPGGLGDDDKRSTAASTSTSDTEATVTTVAEESTTTAPAESTTTQVVTGAAQTGGSTSTTTAGSGLGTDGSGSAGDTPIVNTGGPVWAPPLGGLLLGLAFVTRRLRRHPV